MPPNWFTTVMGTGIVALAAAGLPVQAPGQRTFALLVWMAAAGLLLVLLPVAVHGWVTDRARFAAHLASPVMAHSFGALPMALLTAGAGTLLIGRDVLGLPLALALDAVLWTAGTAGGLLTAVAVPYVAITRHHTPPGSAFGGWLMPVVPPLVSATTGGFLLPFLPAGPPRMAMLLACYAMFGLSLAASLVVISRILHRLVRHGPGPAPLTPTLWIVLGPIGQSITAANVLGQAAGSVAGGPAGAIAAGAGVLYGVIAGGFALLWLGVAGVLTVRAARTGLPFTLAWWSFTFPVGTLVTGTSQLATHTGVTALNWLAALLFGFLLLAWLTVAARTMDGLRRGRVVVVVVGQGQFWRAELGPVPLDRLRG